MEFTSSQSGHMQLLGKHSTGMKATQMFRCAWSTFDNCIRKSAGLQATEVTINKAVIHLHLGTMLWEMCGMKLTHEGMWEWSKVVWSTTLRNASVMRLPALTPNSFLESKNNAAASPQRKMKSLRWCQQHNWTVFYIVKLFKILYWWDCLVPLSLECFEQFREAWA